MEKNVGEVDQIGRIVVGAASGLISVGILANVLPESLSLPELTSPLLGLLAIVLLTTAFTRKCPLCSVLDVESR